MESPQFSHTEQKFRTPEEEIAHLRQQVAERERELAARGAEVHREQVISDKIKDYSYVAPKQVLHPEYETSKSAVKELALNLAPEEHDAKMTELYKVLETQGIKNAISVCDALDDAHVEDDFHRFLVQYIKTKHEIPGLAPKSELFKELSMTLYEVSLPDETPDKEKPLKELVSAMEQFYAGMLSVEDKNDPGRYLTLEIANPNHSEEFIFFVSVPDTKKNLFEKQILSLFHGAKIREIPDDYNIFNEKGVTAASVVSLDKHPIGAAAPPDFACFN